MNHYVRHSAQRRSGLDLRVLKGAFQQASHTCMSKHDGDLCLDNLIILVLQLVTGHAPSLLSVQSGLKLMMQRTVRTRKVAVTTHLLGKAQISWTRTRTTWIPGAMTDSKVLIVRSMRC